MLASSSKRAFNASFRASVKSPSIHISHKSTSAWRHSTAAGIADLRSLSTQARTRTRNQERGRDGAGLRNRPWSFDRDNTQFKRGSQTSLHNMKIQNLLAHNNAAAVVEEALLMKKNGVRPDLMTYNLLLMALSRETLLTESWATFRDMEAAGIEPDVTSFNHLIYAGRRGSSDELYYVLEEMDRRNIKPNSATYDLLIRYYLEGDNLESALCRLAEMNDLGYAPSIKVVGMMIDSVAESGYARLALDIAEAYEQTTVRRLENETWVKLLVACADSLYVGGVERCWEKVVKDLHILLDEGLCQSVLHTAARHGLPTLASDAIRQLEAIGVQFGEQHLAPLLDAFVRNGQLKEAFRTFDLMRTSNIIPRLDTAKTIQQTIQRDPDTIDRAYGFLEELHKENQKVDVVATNVIIRACGFLNDLQRAVGIYKAMPSLGVRPSVETFNLLLTACRSTGHLELAERLFAEMRDAGLKPTEKTYASLISVILMQADYENAFFYLEEMKSAGLTPTYSTYEDIVKKCVAVGDSRFKLAVEELEQMGYQVTPGLRSYIDSGGQEWKANVPFEEKLPFETRNRLKRRQPEASAM